MELQNSSQTAEPSTGGPDVHVRPSLTRRLKSGRAGRTLLGCTRWLVVFGLIATGYFGAAVVHSGLHHASPAPQQQILAATPAQD